MEKHRSRSPVPKQKKDPGEGSSRSGLPISNRYATLPTDEVDILQPAVKEKSIKSRKKNRQSDGASCCDDVISTNVSEVDDFGDAADINAASASAAKMKLPSLVVQNAQLNKLIADFATMGVKAEYKLCRIGTKVIVHTKVDYDRAVKYLKESKAEFFTHDIPGEKPFKTVIRGLPAFDPTTIEAELKDRFKLAPTAVYRITRRDENTKQYPDCLFLVHFQKGSVTLNALKAIRSIKSVIIEWEPYRGGRHDVTQCQRCLNFGHGTRNCHIKPRCSKCTQNHVTSECVVDEAEAIKCANCGGAHHGTDKQCPKREDFKRIRKQASTRNQPGRKKENTPEFRVEDFPPLRATQQTK